MASNTSGISGTIELFDTHAHLDDEQFDSDREGMLARAKEAGVATVVAVGTTFSSSRLCVELAKNYPGVLAAIGIQPNYVAETVPEDWDAVRGLAGSRHVVAIGETGLDRYWDHAPFPLQQDYFDRHLRLSQATGLPFIVHMRDCQDDILAMLREARLRGPLAGVMHSYTGTVEGAEECVHLGLHISFAGMVTYPKSQELREVAAAVPLHRLLIETDSPYLSPHPMRGRRPNEPALLIHTARCLAELRGMAFEEFARVTTGNAKRLFLQQ